MPIVGHIAETGQIVAVDSSPGNVPPNKDDLAFIQQCQSSLPEGCRVNALRIDAAGYQTSIYNQRTEDSENRIKELKRDFAGGTLPCSDFKAEAGFLSEDWGLNEYIGDKFA